MKTHKLINYAPDHYLDISDARKHSQTKDGMIAFLEKKHDEFTGFSGEEFTRKRKAEILEAIRFLNERESHLNLKDMTVTV